MTQANQNRWFYHDDQIDFDIRKQCDQDTLDKIKQDTWLTVTLHPPKDSNVKTIDNIGHEDSAF